MEPAVILLPYKTPKLLKCYMSSHQLIKSNEIELIENNISLIKNVLKYKLKRLKCKTRMVKPNEKILYRKIEMVLNYNGFKSPYLKCFIVYVIDLIKKQYSSILEDTLGNKMW
jgi:hypothetical protein